MRIAVWHSLSYGGARRALYNHLSALKEAGHYLEIWTTDFHQTAFLNFENFGKIHIIEVQGETDKFHEWYKNAASITTTKKIVASLKAAQHTAAIEINTGNFDLAFVNSCSVTYMPFISEFLEIPSVIYLGEPYRWLYEASPENRWQYPGFKTFEVGKKWMDYKINLSRRMQVKYEIDAAKKYSKILVNSFYSKESVLKAYGIEAEVCQLGVDTELFQNKLLHAKENFVVGVGVLYSPKGADRAVELLGRIKKEIRPTLRWICNGVDEQYLHHVQLLAKEKDVDFELLLNISDSELIKNLSAAKFMIYTSRLEPLGLAPLEANSCGTFVIGIAEGGIRETIVHRQNGYLLNGIHDEMFVEYAGSLLSDAPQAVELGEKARDFVVSNWSMKHLGNNIIKSIKSVFN